MSDDDRRWARLNALLDEALDVPPDQRDAFAARACGDDDALREELLAMLADAETPASFLRSGGALDGALGRRLAEEGDGDELGAGQAVGPFSIRSELGRGGMAVVYLAERVDGAYEQQVALKIVKRGTDTDEVLRRFQQERQILASLTHPNIARILDGGVLDDGRPYLAMEYVDGQTITRYCAEHRLSVEARIRLMIDVGRAVAFAHRNLVVHRDLKPSNVMVTREGVAKLMDFGIAKMLDPTDAEQTRTHLLLMTPEYASPEQVLRGPITTATDVYQLGLILYHLLTGQRAQRLKALSYTEVERVVCHQAPARPSAAALSPEEESPEAGPPMDLKPVADTRQLHRSLRGDLDTIILKALHKDPDRRYASADQLVEDLERHLDGRPVRARPDSLWYRAGKFIGRNRIPVAAGILTAALVATLVTFYTWRLADERDRAQLEAAKAQQVSDFLVSLFEQSAPGVAEAGEITVRQALDQGAASIPTRLEDQPEVQATMMLAIGRVYRQLNLNAEALPLLEESLRLRSEAHGTDVDPEVADALNNVAATLFVLGRYQEALPYSLRSIAARRALPPEHRKGLAASLNELGTIHKVLGEYDAARRDYQEGLEVFISELGPQHHLVALQLINMANLEHELDDLDAARVNFDRALGILANAEGKVRLLKGVALGGLGDILREQGQLVEADERLRESREILDLILPEDHHLIGWLFECEGDVLLDGGQPAEALTRYQRARDIYHAEERSQSEASALMRMAWAERDLGDVAAARPHADEAARITFEELGEDHSDGVERLTTLASLSRLEGDPQQAVSHADRALTIASASLREGHRSEVAARVERAKALKALGQGAAFEEERARIEALVAGDARPAFQQALTGLAAAEAPGP